MSRLTGGPSTAPIRLSPQTALPQVTSEAQKAPSDPVIPLLAAGGGPSPAGHPSFAPSALDATLSDVLASRLGEKVEIHGDFSAILRQARRVERALGEQPLPITNHNSRLILKLFGG